jgi:Xaa-Pro aminopeptidase
MPSPARVPRHATGARARMHYAASERDPDMLYATGLLAPDPFLFLEIGRRRLVAVSDLELGRARAQARVQEVLSWTAQARALPPQVQPASPARVIRHILAERRLRHVTVPSAFPAGIARALTQAGVHLEIAADPFWPRREIKQPAEIRAITAALRSAEAGIAAGIAALRACRVRLDGLLWRHGRTFTAEDLRAVVNAAVLAHGALPANTICACGDQAVDPHESGHGPLKAHTPIVIDVFPRAEATGYFADITRTVVRGRASQRVRTMYSVVSAALDLVLAKARPGARAAALHECVRAHFVRAGFTTAEHQGQMQGFFHGTGHGVGLAVHESPLVSERRPGRLRAGQVVALEPGLYYRGAGGVRIEELVVITRSGCRNLARLPRLLEI